MLGMSGVGSPRFDISEISAPPLDEEEMKLKMQIKDILSSMKKNNQRVI